MRDYYKDTTTLVVPHRVCMQHVDSSDLYRILWGADDFWG